MRMSSTAYLSLASVGLFLAAVSACRGDETETENPNTTPTTTTNVGGSGGGTTTTTTSDGGTTTTTTTTGTTTTTTGTTTTTTGTGGSGGSEPWVPEDTATLVISEVRVIGSEFIEIYNGTGAAIDLSNYYLTDATYLDTTPTPDESTYYYNIVNPSSAYAGGGAYGDFHARFPDGATIAHGEFQIIAINGSDKFAEDYPNLTPDYELVEGATADNIPDMREAFADSIPAVADAATMLTNDGEVVILYVWDGSSDLVEDVDYLVWGDKAEAVCKTGVAKDGPDGDTNTSSYADDTAIASQAVATAGSDDWSFTRVDFSEGTETLTNGNGISGHDEMSENINQTFAAAAPTPGSPPAN